MDESEEEWIGQYLEEVAENVDCTLTLIATPHLAINEPLILRSTEPKSVLNKTRVNTNKGQVSSISVCGFPGAAAKDR